MWSVDELFVLSDIHMTAENNVGLFQVDTELANCLHWILTETRNSLVLLNGDILDFLPMRTGETINDFNNLGELTQKIIEHHPEVFDALAELARSPKHQLIIMSGNHDPELVFPLTQETIERRLGLNFSNPVIRWSVQGEALRLQVGNAVVLIEHGNALDPWNRIDHDGLRIAYALASRNLSDGIDYQPPLGSRLVLEVVNELRESFHWIDFLKPETEAALPLLRHFCSWRQQKSILSLADNYLSLKNFAMNKINLRNPEKLYKGEKEIGKSPKDKAFESWVHAVSNHERPTLEGNRQKEKLIEKLRLVSSQDNFFEINKPDDSIPYLIPIFKGGTDLVIHGHTHSAKSYAVEGGWYLNTGTWGQLLRLPKSYESDEIWQDFLEILQKDKAESFRRLTFARIENVQEENVTTASLLEWQGSEPQVLSKRRFSDRKLGWQQGELTS